MEQAPKFRTDLVVFRQEDHTGKERVVLKDPVSEKFYRLSEYEFAFLKTLDGARSVEHAVEALRAAGRHYALEDAKFIVGTAAQAGLLLGTRFSTAPFQQDLKARLEKAKRARLFSSIYFLFVPLFNPDRFLERTFPIFKAVANRWTLTLVACAVPGALYLLISGLPRLQTEYLFFFNWENLLYLWVTVAIAKLVHELSHAYVAKSFGLRVPEMGLAFLIFFPCLYCNTTDAWQLADRRQCAAISAAGIAAEAVLATCAAYVWSFSMPGLVNSLAFYLMAVSFVSTVLFNGNPLMKFDGYFMLSDFLGMPNLSPNSLKYLKYLFMNRVMGNDFIPNPARTRKETVIFTTYGISAFLYRVSLYTSLVVTVYYRFDKLLGILLAVPAVALFILRPIRAGLASLYRSRSRLRPRLAGSVVLLLTVVAVLAALFVPWSGKSVYPCFVASREVQKLTVPLHTLVAEVFVRDGTAVRRGDLLFQLDVTQLQLKLVQKQIQSELLQKEIQLLAVDEKLRSKIEGREVELRQAEDDIRHLQELVRLAQSSIRAPFDGVVTTLDRRMQPGFQPGEGGVVGELQSQEECVVHALVPAEDIHQVRVGQPVEIWFPMGTGTMLAGKIDSVKAYSEADLRNSPFSSRFGGELATEVMGENRRDAPLEAQYCCSFFFKNVSDPLPLGMTGRMAITFPPRSAATRLMDGLMRAFNRESIL